MNEYNFEWDADKHSKNQRKHRVSFEEAKTVFSDEFARLIPDPDNSIGEERFILMGCSIESRVLIVCHCVRDGDVIRIISARKADKKERKQYEDLRYA